MALHTFLPSERRHAAPIDRPVPSVSIGSICGCVFNCANRPNLRMACFLAIAVFVPLSARRPRSSLRNPAATGRRIEREPAAPLASKNEQTKPNLVTQLNARPRFWSANAVRTVGCERACAHELRLPVRSDSTSMPRVRTTHGRVSDGWLPARGGGCAAGLPDFPGGPAFSSSLAAPRSPKRERSVQKVPSPAKKS